MSIGRSKIKTRTIYPNGKKEAPPNLYLRKYALLCYNLALLGATVPQMAEVLQINPDTVNEWQKRFPDFKDAIKRGRAQADAEVAHSLYHRAVGYSHPDVHVAVIKDRRTGEIDTVVTPITKYYPPDTYACIFWLKNKQKELWSDVRRQEHTGKDGNEIRIRREINLTNLTDAELELAEKVGLKLLRSKNEQQEEVETIPGLSNTGNELVN